MTPEQREQIIHSLQKGEDLSPEWARILFPPEKREYELVYHGKEREEDILGNTLAVPLQPVRTFGKNGHDSVDQWQNMLVFGDNLQVMKSLLELKKAGKLCNADGSPGVRLVYIDPPFATMQEPVINPMAKERLGYPTQKPELLLDRVVRSSSKTGDLIVDAFAGSGTILCCRREAGPALDSYRLREAGDLYHAEAAVESS